MGDEHVVRRRVPGRAVDPRSGRCTARAPAQLGGVRAAPSRASGADHRQVAARLGQGTGNWCTGAERSARFVDTAVAWADARRSALLESFPQRGGQPDRRPHRSPEPGLPEALGSVPARRALADTGRALSRPRREPRWVDVDARAPRGIRHRCRQGAPRRTRRGDARGALPQRERVLDRTRIVRRARLVVQRCDRLSEAHVRTGRALASIRKRAQHDREHEVPRRDRPRDRSCVRVHRRQPALPLAPQSPRADVRIVARQKRSGHATHSNVLRNVGGVVPNTSQPPAT